jgi:hypothetical protein
MSPLYQHMARTRMREAEAEAAQARLALRLLAAKRWQRRAEQASHRARRAAAAISLPVRV